MTRTLLNTRFIIACVAAICADLPTPAWAQFTDPRSYENTAVGTNQIELSFAHVHGTATIDTSIVVAGANLDLNQVTIDYTRYFGPFHRLMWVEAAVPVARLSGSISGLNVQRGTTGTGDSSYAVAMLLTGGPALSVQQFEQYRPTTTLGASVTITAPTGSYNPETVLNLGAGRWSFKPELALSHPFGPEQKWMVEGYANVYFYSDNTSYRGREILRQEPLPGFEGHLSYSVTDTLWAAVDARYSFRGATLVNGVSQDNPQRNFTLGGEVNIALNSRNSLVFEIAKALVHTNGPALVGLSVKYAYAWARGDDQRVLESP